MLARALIVLLVVLNLGVAAWWVSRPDSAARPQLDTLDGVATLRLAGEVPATQRSAAVPAAPALSVGDVAATLRADAAAAVGSPPAESPPAESTAAGSASAAPELASVPLPVAAVSDAAPAAAPRCFALGPFADAAAVASARTRLQGQVLRLRERSVAPTAARGWRVWLPPLADRAAAQATVERLRAAGFSDLFVLASGEDSNGIALGRFGSESSARQHETALRAAGFAAARAEPIGGGDAGTAIDVAVAATVTPAGLRQLAGAARASAVDCATVP